MSKFEREIRLPAAGGTIYVSIEGNSIVIAEVRTYDPIFVSGVDAERLADAILEAVKHLRQTETRE